MYDVGNLQGINVKANAVLHIVQEFIKKHNLSCPETIYQVDKVIEDAYGFIEDLCNAAGYKE